jgi:uncharacterized membrane protein
VPITLLIVLARLSTIVTRLNDLESSVRKAMSLVAELDQKFLQIGRKAEEPAHEKEEPQRKPAPSERLDFSRAIPGPAPAVVAPPPVAMNRAALPEVPASPAPPPKNFRTKEEWEALIGGKLLNRVGALALILGVGFFLQYAFANDLIPEPVRVLIGVAAGALSLVGAARSASRGFQVFAQGLVGAGIAILYLSVYASFNFYHLVSQPYAFVFMSAVTVITFTQAFRYDSIIVALLGWLGGFLTPYLLSTGEVNPVGLFTYLAVMDLGLLVIVWKKDAWVSIEPLGMAGTYLFYLLWLLKDYSGAQFGTALVFLTLFWAMFHAVHLARIARNIPTYQELRLPLASAHGLVVYLLLYDVVKTAHGEWRGGATLVLALLYLVTALFAIRRPGAERFFLQSVLSAIVLIVVATGIEFKGLTIVAYWSVEALALICAGVYWRLRPVWYSGLALYVLTLLTLILTDGSLVYSSQGPFTVILNQRAFTFALLAFTLALSIPLLRQTEDPNLRTIQAALHVGWCVVVFTLITVETNDLYTSLLLTARGSAAESLSFLRFMILPAVWGVYSLPLILGGVRINVRPVLYPGLWILIVAGCLAGIRGLDYQPIVLFKPVLNERTLVLLLVITIIAFSGRLLSSREKASDWLHEINGALQIMIVLLFLVLLTGETWDYFSMEISRLAGTFTGGEISAEVTRLENLRQLFLSGGWLVFSVLLMAIGLWRRNRIQRIEAIVMFGVSILKIFVYDLSFLDTLYRIFSFIGLGVILLVVSYMYQRYRMIILGPGEPQARHESAGRD